MKTRWSNKTTFGLVVWVFALGALLYGFKTLNSNQIVNASVQRLSNYWTTPQVEKTAIAANGAPLMYRDPVFRIVDGQFQRIGQVIDSPNGYVEADERVRFRLFDRADQYWDEGYLEVHRPAKNLGRVAEVMLTPERVQRIREILLEAQTAHQAEVVAELTPLFQSALQDLRPVIEAELVSTMQQHRSDVDALVEKYKERIVKQKLLPVVESDVLPVVQKHAQPVMEEIGGEIWTRVSLWRFAWRFIYDESIDPNEPLVKKEWQRFLNNEAIPIIRSHTDQIVATQSNIIEELAKNPKIKEALKESLQEITNDEDAKQLVRSILQESLTKNDRVQNELKAFFQSEATQAALRRVGDRFEPYAVQIGQELFGTPEEVTKEFALVLRHMILNKDQRWLVWKPGPIPYSVPESKGSIPMIWTDEISMPPFFRPSGLLSNSDE